MVNLSEHEKQRAAAAGYNEAEIADIVEATENAFKSAMTAIEASVNHLPTEGARVSAYITTLQMLSQRYLMATSLLDLADAFEVRRR